MGDLQILSTEALPMVVRGLRIRLGIIAVPAGAAQTVVDQMASAGIRAILSYAPINMRAPKDVRLRNIDPVVMLQSMTYHLKDVT